jgi:hypothetical protein
MNTRNKHNHGAALLVVVVSMVAAGVVGAAVLSVATSTRYERINTGVSSRAYYLAESGVGYIRSRHEADPSFATNGTFRFGNGDTFHVASTNTTMVTSNPATGVLTTSRVLKVVSTGTANPGTPLEAIRRLTFEITPNFSTNPLPVGFYDETGGFNEDLWNVDGLTPRALTEETGHSGGELALDLAGTEGQLALNWQDQEDLDLTRAWAWNNLLLNYDVQTKIMAYENPGLGFGQHYLLGISFRLQTNGACYGLSYFRSLTHSPSSGNLIQDNQRPSWARDARLSAGFQALRGTNDHLVLWYRDSTSGIQQLLRSRRLLPTDNVISNYGPSVSPALGLVPYATLLVQVDERYVGTNRQNHITAYIQGPSVYEPWPNNDLSNAIWQENAVAFPSPVVWDDGGSEVVDGRVTSAGFDVVGTTNCPPEIGIHVYYDQSGANNKFFDDFALRLEAFPDGGNQIQY